MLTFVITGDRSANPNFTVPIVQQLLLKLAVQLGQPFHLVAGGLQGVEQAVKYVAESAGIALVTVPFEPLTKDWDAYAQLLKGENPERVYFIHGQPESSRLYPALTKVFGDNDFELVNPDLLFAPTA